MCLIEYLAPGVRLSCSSIQQIMASMSWPTSGWLCGRQIMSPREMSISSVRVMATDIGANASSTGPSGPSMRSMVVAKPDGSATTSSPGLSTPPAIVPA